MVIIKRQNDRCRQVGQPVDQRREQPVVGSAFRGVQQWGQFVGQPVNGLF